jgi:hypothetical protein
MQFVFNAFGYELFARFTKKPPIPLVIVAKDDKLDVSDVAELMRNCGV